MRSGELRQHRGLQRAGLFVLVIGCLFGLLSGLGTRPASGDDGTPTTPTTTSSTPPGGPLDPDPFHNPKNYTLFFHAYTQYGPICVAGHGCNYMPLPGTLVTVYTLSGKEIRHAYSKADGRVVVLLPKGKSRVRFFHTTYKGHRMGGKSYTVTAPVFRPPGSKDRGFVFTFCTGGGYC